MTTKRIRWIVAAAMTGVFSLLLIDSGGCHDRKEALMSPNASTRPSGEDPFASPSEGRERAVFAAGCFWGVEATFRQIPGVLATRVGYIGGHAAEPTYHEVCSDTTGHAEAVEIVYDPSEVTYEQLLDVFWNAHDPTQVNRQGPDYGSQYRSVIFFVNDRQKQLAEASRDRLDDSRKHRKPIATKIEPAREFWPAEDYHQQYLEKRGMASCHSGLQ